jgi:hypothetical protein
LQLIGYLTSFAEILIPDPSLFMKNLLATLFFTAFCIFCLAQQNPVKPFGEVTPEEMNIAICPYDSSATAMILFDYGDAVMDVARGSSFKRHVRIKIFKKEAADEWATKIVFFDKTDQFFSKFQASTYNLVDGKIVATKTGEDALLKSKFDKYTNQVRFTLPQVKEGSILEYTYTVSSNELIGLPDWQFQYEIPVLWSEYSMSIPYYFTFRKDWSGFLSPTINESKRNGDLQRIVISNVPAFKEEPFMTSKENYISKLSMHLDKLWVPGQMERSFIKTWGHVASRVYESDLWNQIRSSFYLKKIAEEQTAGITDPEKKVHALYDYVKKNITWDETTDVYPDHQFKEVLESKKGSSSEINGLLISMLMKIDIDANPVLLRTRNKGYVQPFIPMASQFNDVICHVAIGEKTMLIDATNDGLPINALPERCLNGEGFIVRKDTWAWVDLKTIKSRRTTNGDFVLKEDGSIKGKLTISLEGNYGSEMRKEYKKESEEEYIKGSINGAWDVSKSSFENIDNYTSPVKEIHELTIPDYGQSMNSLIYINPIIFDRMEKNRFRTEKREYPVDYGSPFDEIYLGKITLPDNYVVEELPKSKVFILPNGGGKYVYNISVVGNAINVISQLIINKSSFSTDEYPLLRELYNQVVAKQAEQIVLKKK